ncbi:hypothetical protein [Aquabacterium sp.]|uniref:hypothetical protein n=1 Tax=Aquabacterium sp. TaxID=1872578 RepID=UPI0035AE972A
MATRNGGSARKHPERFDRAIAPPNTQVVSLKKRRRIIFLVSCRLDGPTIMTILHVNVVPVSRESDHPHG